MESAGETKPADVLVHHKEPQRRSPVNGTQATAILLRPAQTAATSARSGRSQPHRQTTARTHRSEPSLPAKRCAPGHANHQRPNAKRQGTHGRSDQTEDAKAEHERTTEATGEAHRRTPGHAPKKGHPARQDQRPERRQTHRLRDRQRTKDRHRHRRRKARPAPEQTTRRAQETQGNHGSRTHRRRRQAKPTPPGPTGTKNTATAEKTQKQGQNRW